jgi:hypothetical protein
VLGDKNLHTRMRDEEFTDTETKYGLLLLELGGLLELFRLFRAVPYRLQAMVIARVD